ncbi:MAG: DNA primase DnaG [Candidatus Poseidoniia archaeon]|nr:DNA primase DnaG [Candidatus Poseidoniia archaeon]
MSKDPNSNKYMISASITANGVVDRSDVVGAIFGQTEGLLGDNLDLRDLQKSGRMGRIEVDIKSSKGKSQGVITIASSMDQVETSVFAAALETVERVGPCKATLKVTALEDTRAGKHDQIIERARELLLNIVSESRSTGGDITDSVRELVQTEEIILFAGKLPAGPNVEQSDAIILVEGRADVLTMLRHGIKNCISVEGTDIPAEISELSKARTVTAFVDGDRGGEMILRELFQVAEIDFVARAPTNTEVEQLTHKQVMKCLRDKSTTGVFQDKHRWARADGKKKRSRRGGRKSKAKQVDVVAEAPEEAPASEPADVPEPPAEEAVQPEVMEAAPAAASSRPAAAEALLEHLDALKGSKNARLLADNKVSVELPITKLQEQLQKKGNNGVNALVMDGIITQRLVDLVPEAGISTIVAEKKGPLPRKPATVKLYTRKDLG